MDTPREMNISAVKGWGSMKLFTDIVFTARNLFFCPQNSYIKLAFLCFVMARKHFGLLTDDAISI